MTQGPATRAALVDLLTKRGFQIAIHDPALFERIKET